MNFINKIILKVLIILSIIILISGIFIARNTKNEIKNEGMPTQNIYIDGTDVTDYTEAFVEIGSGLLGIVIVFYSIFVVACIWGIYGIILLIIITIKKIRQRNELPRKS